MFTDINSYKPSFLEQIVIDTYQQLGISHPSEIDMYTIADHFGLSIMELDVRSKVMGSTIVIDSRLYPEEQREDFFHELTHAIRHAGNQLGMTDLFREAQETEANRMPYYWLVPSFMLIEQIDLSLPLPWLIKQLAEIFNVTEKFMEKRLQLLKARIEINAAKHQLCAAMEKVPKYALIRTIGLTEYYCDALGNVLFTRRRAEL
ncbi:ImmA/IrrE family metallo-endopeptidase [Effusibacillus consociatus]|uniref:ImmA/IrrE family metallo-endopeptidase n=1 Tax=Effusibacillus consociatus TaxID=1117041 RepID=A0ABV9Q2D6_9BACL